jgi:hypothetical protein
LQPIEKLPNEISEQQAAAIATDFVFRLTGRRYDADQIGCGLYEQAARGAELDSGSTTRRWLCNKRSGFKRSEFWYLEVYSLTGEPVHFEDFEDGYKRARVRLGKARFTTAEGWKAHFRSIAARIGASDSKIVKLQWNGALENRNTTSSEFVFATLAGPADWPDWGLGCDLVDGEVIYFNRPLSRRPQVASAR